MNRLLDDFLIYPYESRTDSYWNEHEDHYNTDLNLAGFKKKDIKIIIDNNILKISATKEGSGYSKNLLLPKGAEPQTASVTHEDGLLSVKIDKKESVKTIELKIK